MVTTTREQGGYISRNRLLIGAALVLGLYVVFAWQLAWWPFEAPSVEVLVPNGGETWKIGEARTIKFAAKNVPVESYFRVKLISDSGQSVDVESLQPERSEAYTVQWRVPAGHYDNMGRVVPLQTGDDFKILVELFSGYLITPANAPDRGDVPKKKKSTSKLLARDESDAFFLITVEPELSAGDITKISLTASAPSTFTTLTFRSDGLVEYAARPRRPNYSFVEDGGGKIVGLQYDAAGTGLKSIADSARVTADEYKVLADLIGSTNFASFKDEYREPDVKDAVTYVITVKRGNTAKSVLCYVRCPAEVVAIRNKIKGLWGREFAVIGI